MAGAGVAWGIYSLRGRREGAPPLAANAGNLARATPFAAIAFAIATAAGALHATPHGLVLALVSGALTSGLGYAIWYAALPHLTAATAGLVQLAVPVVAAAGGVVLFGERLTPRLLAAGALVLAGIALALFVPRAASSRSRSSSRS
jgi:drug/metabolite transporter (DMT)-like permease